MKTIEHNGAAYNVSEKGYLVDFPEKLEKNWIDYVCVCEGIREVTPEHMEVVNKLWGYYEESKTIPRFGMISKITGYSLKRIFEMFPSGPSGAGKMAGFQGKIC